MEDKAAASLGLGKGSCYCSSVVGLAPTLDVLCEIGLLLGSVNFATTEDLAIAALGVRQGTLGTPTVAETATCLSVLETLPLLLFLWLVEAAPVCQCVHVGPHISYWMMLSWLLVKNNVVVAAMID